MQARIQRSVLYIYDCCWDDNTIAAVADSRNSCTIAVSKGTPFGPPRHLPLLGPFSSMPRQDHKPNREDEVERIKRAGGMVIHKRVMGELAVSRAFGDRAFKIGIKVCFSRHGAPTLLY